MGLLLLAHDQDSGCRAVLKMPRQQMSRDASSLARFEHEIALLRRLRHPRIPRWLGDGNAAGRRVLAVEHVEGLTLAQLVHRRSWLPAAQAVPIAADVLAALHATHSMTADDGAPLGVLHRDVSPQNVVVDRNGVGHLIDFGASTDATFDGAVEEGHVVGKAGYMAPEIVLGRELGPYTDQFAAGIVLWEMLTGRRLFRSDTERSTWRSIVRCEVPPPEEIVPSVPRKVSQCVTRMLQANPEDRYPTCAAAAVALCFAVEERRIRLDGDDVAAGRIVRSRAARTVRLRPLKSRPSATLEVTAGDVVAAGPPSIPVTTGPMSAGPTLAPALPDGSPLPPNADANLDANLDANVGVASRSADAQAEGSAAAGAVGVG